MKRFANLFLAVIFALLQSIAPVAHAHINASSMDKGVHLPEVELQDGHGTCELSSGNNVWESAAVSASQGCERNCTRAAADLQAFYIKAMPQHAAEETAAVYASNSSSPFIHPRAGSLRPYPQAPPASTLL